VGEVPPLTGIPRRAEGESGVLVVMLGRFQSYR